MSFNKQNKKNNKFLIITTLLFFFCFNFLYSQNKSLLDSAITFKARNITLHEGLNRIGDIIGLEFSYNSDLLQSENKIKANYTNIVLRSLLTELLGDTTLTYLQVDKQIVIRKKNLVNQLSLKSEILEPGNLQLKGKVIDKITGENLAFANISILQKSIGTVTNENGDFNLKISKDNLFDTLVFSYIGYRNALIPIKELSVYNNSIYMEKDNLQIQEVIIRINDARKILNEAIDKISYNYYTDPYYITSFYREIINQRKELGAITEAVLKVYKSPYMGLFSDQVKLIKSRKNEYFSREDSVSFKLKGGLNTSLYLDVIKNPTYFISKEYMHLYSYSVKEIVKFNNSTAYVIGFRPKHYLEENSFEGEIFINTDDLAIVEIHFNIVPDAIKKIGKSLVVKKTFRTRVTPVSADYIISYRKLNNKYFVNLVRGELEFKVKQKKRLFMSDYKTMFEFATNDIDTLNVERFNRIETISKNNIFIDENYQYDKQFWGRYNYISPDESLEEALKRIQIQLERIEE